MEQLLGGGKKKWKKHLWMISSNNQPRYITYLGDDWYQIEGPTTFLRYTLDQAADFEGGPFLVKGDFFDLYSEICEVVLDTPPKNNTAYAIVRIKTRSNDGRN